MRYRSRGFDHLGTLRSRLADLQGFATLAFELVQNAEDAQSEWLRFEIGHDALIVDNSSQFSSCGDLDTERCELERSCDFHRFANIGSGDKRLDPNSIGAFGIGFLTVYQITDHPELISAGQHWILNELAPADQRIQICDNPDCGVCHRSDLPGTRFVLPFAVTPSAMRTALSFDPVTSDQITELAKRLEEALPESLLFLDALNQLELRRQGALVGAIDCVREDDRVLMTSTSGDRAWWLLRSSVPAEDIERLGQAIGGGDVARDAGVVLAFGDGEDEGRYFAWLPTQERLGLPFHVHADFFPSNDRKHVLWEGDYRSTWNRACLQAVAEVLAANLESVRTQLTPTGFWGLIQTAQSPREVEQAGVFWPKLLRQIQSGPFVLTDADQWVEPGEAVFVDPRFRSGIDALRALGIQPVHGDLNEFRNLLVDRTNGAGVPLLTLHHVVAAWTEPGDGSLTDSAQAVLRKQSLRMQVWSLIEIMLADTRTQELDRQALSGLELLLTLSGSTVSPAEGRKADPITRGLFELVDADSPVIDLPEADYPRLAGLVSDWSALDGIEALERYFSAREEAPVALPHTDLIKWFSVRLNEVVENGLEGRLAALPVFPTGGTQAPLPGLALPSDFKDPLQLANLVDLTDIRECLALLEALGVRSLDIVSYVRDHLLPAIGESEASADLMRAGVLLLASNPSVLDDADVLNRLRQASVVPCRGGTYARPAECYLPSAELGLLAGEPLVAELLPENLTGGQALYTALGVAARPRLVDLIASVASITASAPSDESVERISDMFDALSQRFDKDNQTTVGEMDKLRALAWLPADGDRDSWHPPPDLFAVFQRHIFRTQGTFLGLSSAVQGSGRDLLEFLGVQLVPQTSQVVDHLLVCSRQGTPVHPDVYRTLNERSDDAAVSRLTSMACIYLERHGFWRPEHVFWHQHGFGRFRLALEPQLGAYHDFFTAVGVPPHEPDHESALDMLAEVAESADFQSGPLPDEEYNVVRYSWRLLTEAIDRNLIDADRLAQLSDKRVVPDASRQLNRPDRLFFADRGSLADAMSPTIGPNIIPLDRLRAVAMEAAGVRRLTNAAALELVAIGDRVPAEDVLAHLRERRNEIARVVALDPGSISQRLDALAVERAEPISVKYSVAMLGRTLSSPQLEPEAILISSEGVILISGADPPPWAVLARELGSYLLQDEDATTTAHGLYLVLASESQEEAESLLDSLGCPSVVTEPAVEIAGTQAGGLGDVRADEGCQGIPVPAGRQEHEAPGDGALPESSLPSHDSSPRRRARRFKRSRFVTYVATPGEPAGDAADQELGSLRKRVADAGVAVAIAHEKQMGWHPKVMPPNHKGYDIESSDADGQVIRYIEVKALSGSWGSDGVGLTAPEFEKASAHGATYWLYVVEYADTEEVELHTICDPARTVTHFFYDHGWRAVSTTLEEQSAAAAEHEGEDTASPTGHDFAVRDE